MALRLKISAEEFKKSFAVFNCTGDHSSDNKGGFGGPNPRIQDITSSIVEVEGPTEPASPNFDPQQAILNTPPGSNSYVNPPANGQPVGAIVPLVGKFELVGNFPNDKNLGYEILPTMFGSNVDKKVTSGKWVIRWTVSGVDVHGKKFKAQTMLVVVFMNEVTCCVDKQLQNLDKNAFKDPKQRAITELGVLLDAACRSKKCGKYDEADETIRFLNQQCVCVTC